MTDPGPDALDLLRRRVINVVGHELRTPLTTIRGLAELLEDASPAEVRDAIGPALLRSARRAERLLDDLLIATGVSTAQPTEPAESFDLVAATRDAAGEAEGEVLVVAAGPVAAHAHPAAVVAAIGHLLENALRYGDGTVTATVADVGDRSEVGVHVPVEQLPDLTLAFELFFRGEVAVTRTPGLGIGLPVARALARAEGGDVELAAADGAVVARLWLPAAGGPGGA